MDGVEVGFGLILRPGVVEFQLKFIGKRGSSLEKGRAFCIIERVASDKCSHIFGDGSFLPRQVCTGDCKDKYCCKIILLMMN